VSLAEQLRQALDPVAFARACGFEPDPWQAEVLRSTHPRLALNCSRQSGKSQVAATRTVWTAVHQPGSTVVLVSPSMRQKTTVTTRMRSITTDLAPELVAKPGVGPDTATTLLITAGDNPDRLRHEKSFAALVGASPIPVNSGQIQDRFRLNRGGDRQANSALWRIAIVRMSSDQATRDDVARRQAEGKTKSEAIRCLKRYIAREVYNALPKQAIA
jgi:transposase